MILARTRWPRPPRWARRPDWAGAAPPLAPRPGSETEPGGEVGSAPPAPGHGGAPGRRLWEWARGPGAALGEPSAGLDGLSSPPLPPPHWDWGPESASGPPRVEQARRGPGTRALCVPSLWHRALWEGPRAVTFPRRGPSRKCRLPAAGPFRTMRAGRSGRARPSCRRGRPVARPLGGASGPPRGAVGVGCACSQVRAPRPGSALPSTPDSSEVKHPAPPLALA